MILVTLGTQDKEFKRILKIIEDEIINGNIHDKVIVQAGNTKYSSKYMEIFDFIDRNEFADLIKKCDILITHGGVGSIISGLQMNKKVLVAPRLAKYNEHVNDHQLQITKNFSEKGYIIPLYENESLMEKLELLRKFKPNKFQSNTNNIVNIIKDYIDKN